MDMNYCKRLIKSFTLVCLGLVAQTACNGESKPQATDEKKVPEVTQKSDAKAEEASEKRDLSTSIDKPFEALDISGPVPPEISMVFFKVDGALMPLACYNKAKNTIESRASCLALIAKGSEVYLKSKFSAVLDKTGEPKNSLCEAGDEGSPKSLSTPRLDEQQAFDWSVWPKSSAQKVIEIGPESLSQPFLQKIGSDEIGELQAAVKSISSAAEGKLELHQFAELDIDGDKQAERFFSVFIVNPRDTARFLFSGLLVKFGADAKKVVLVEKSQSGREVFTLKGAIDFNGDGTYELWTNAAFDEGGGDHIVGVKANSFKSLSPWTCGL